MQRLRKKKEAVGDLPLRVEGTTFGKSPLLYQY